MYYTLGQRRGFGIGGVRGGDESAWYVLAKDLGRNVLIVGQGHDHPFMQSDRLLAGQLCWCRERTGVASFRAQAKVRYRQEDQPCAVTLLSDGMAEVVFDAPQRAITPGQSVVFYEGDECLGGGVIEKTSYQGEPRGLL